MAQCFYRVAADLAGVVLTKPELEAELKVVDAEVSRAHLFSRLVSAGCKLAGPWPWVCRSSEMAVRW